MIPAPTLRAIAALCGHHHPAVTAVARLDVGGLRLVQKSGRRVSPTLISWSSLERDGISAVREALDRGVAELGLEMVA